jgi:hypothetical protein
MDPPSPSNTTTTSTAHLSSTTPSSSFVPPGPFTTPELFIHPSPGELKYGFLPWISDDFVEEVLSDRIGMGDVVVGKK